MTAAAVLVLTSPFNAASHDTELSMSPMRRRPVGLSIALTLRSDNYGQLHGFFLPMILTKAQASKPMPGPRTKDQAFKAKDRTKYLPMHIPIAEN